MSRSSDIVYQIQHRRAERKKPKINAQLKKVSIDESQKGRINAAQENKPPPITMQKTGGRNSFALTFSVGLHVAIALLLGFLYIKDQISSASDDLEVAFVPQEMQQRERPPFKTPRPKFEPTQHEIKNPIQRAPVTNANIPRVEGGFELPTATDTDLGPVGPSLNKTPKVTGIGQGVRVPVQSEQTVITPTIERPKQGAPTPDIPDLPPTDGPTLDVPDGIDTSEPGSSPPKRKYAPEPIYPANAKRAEKEGTVTLRATIGKNGIPKKIVAETKLGFGLEGAAIAALKKWRFIPAKKKGEDVEVTVRIDIQFKLDDK